MTEKAAVVVNYTDEMTAKVVEAYKAGTAVEVIAAEIGKSVKSVISKLSREGVYVAKSKTASARVTKADMVAKIATALEVELEAVASLEKATQGALETLLAALA